MSGVTQAWTAEELRQRFLDHGRTLVDYWAGVSSHTDREKLSGLLHSLLTTIDGQSGGFPCSMDLVCRPHPDDKAFLQAEGERWVEDGTVLNESDLLHELLYSEAWR